jgi:dihydrofolate reductase
MTRVFAALAVSVDGFITGRDPGPGHGLGDGGTLFDWYTDGDVRSRAFGGFHLSAASARVFDDIADRVGVSLVGRNTYDDSQWDRGGAPHPTAPLVLLTHRAAPSGLDRQTVVRTGVEDAIATAKALAGDRDVALMGGGVTASALAAGLVDELILHQVPVLLGAGRRFFPALPRHIGLRIRDVVPAPGVTHLFYDVIETDPS